MDLNQQLNAMKHSVPLVPREEALLHTLDAAKDAFFLAEQSHILTGQAFLWSQFCRIRKRWWTLQALLLLLAVLLLPEMTNHALQIRSTGIIGCLFAIFLIPELWRNKSSHSTQVEAACLYSLRQIYAARFALFGIVDVFLLTLFCFGLHSRLGMDAAELMRQFLLPTTVTAGICFQTLSSCRSYSESGCLILSLCWCFVWWMLTCSSRIYLAIVPGLWLVLFLLSLVFLTAAVQRTLRTTNQCWEVTFS